MSCFSFLVIYLLNSTVYNLEYSFISRIFSYSGGSIRQWYSVTRRRLKGTPSNIQMLIKVPWKINTSKILLAAICEVVRCPYEINLLCKKFFCCLSQKRKSFLENLEFLFRMLLLWFPLVLLHPFLIILYKRFSLVKAEIISPSIQSRYICSYRMQFVLLRFGVESVLLLVSAYSS